MEKKGVVSATGFPRCDCFFDQDYIKKVKTRFYREYPELKGKKIPDDLSIIGFDDIKEVTYVFPALTTVRQNIEEKGRIVMETLKEAIENENFEQKIIEVKTELIVRNSTKKYE